CNKISRNEIPVFRWVLEADQCKRTARRLRSPRAVRSLETVKNQLGAGSKPLTDSCTSSALALGAASWANGAAASPSVSILKAPTVRNRLPACSFIFIVATATRSEEHTSELQSRENLVCRLLLEKKNIKERSLT